MYGQCQCLCARSLRFGQGQASRAQALSSGVCGVWLVDRSSAFNPAVCGQTTTDHAHVPEDALPLMWIPGVAA